MSRLGQAGLNGPLSALFHFLCQTFYSHSLQGVPCGSCALYFCLHEIFICAKTTQATLYTFAQLALITGCVKSLPKSCASVVSLPSILLLVEGRELHRDVFRAGGAALPVGKGGEGLEQRGRLPL